MKIKGWLDDGKYIEKYVEDKLECDENNGSVEVAQINAIHSQEAIARFCEVLAKKGILTAREISYIASGYEDNKAIFIENSEKEPEKELEKIDYLKCKKCKGNMKHGKAIENTWRISSDFIGDEPGQGVTMSIGGTGKIIEVLKCEKCGWSITS